MKAQVTQLGGLIGAIGATGTVIYVVKHKTPIVKSLLLVAAFGVAGMLVGNAITKFYE